MMREMSNYYNIINHVSIKFRPFGLECVFIYYINYSRKLLKVFISMSLTFYFFMSSFLSDNFQSHIEKIQKEKEIIE